MGLCWFMPCVRKEQWRLNHRRRIGKPQNHAINKMCAATRGAAGRLPGLISGRSVLLAHPGCPQPGCAGLPLQQEGSDTAGRCLGARWDSRCSGSAHTCSHASVSTGSLLNAGELLPLLQRKKPGCSEVGEIRRGHGCCRSEISVCPCLEGSWLCPDLCWLFCRWL